MTRKDFRELATILGETKAEPLTLITTLPC